MAHGCDIGRRIVVVVAVSVLAPGRALVGGLEEVTDFRRDEDCGCPDRVGQHRVAGDEPGLLRVRAAEALRILRRGPVAAVADEAEPARVRGASRMRDAHAVDGRECLRRLAGLVDGDERAERRDAAGRHAAVDARARDGVDGVSVRRGAEAHAAEQIGARRGP